MARSNEEIVHQGRLLAPSEKEYTHHQIPYLKIAGNESIEGFQADSRSRCGKRRVELSHSAGEVLHARKKKAFFVLFLFHIHKKKRKVLMRVEVGYIRMEPSISFSLFKKKRLMKNTESLLFEFFLEKEVIEGDRRK